MDFSSNVDLTHVNNGVLFMCIEWGPGWGGVPNSVLNTKFRAYS